MPEQTRDGARPEGLDGDERQRRDPREDAPTLDAIEAERRGPEELTGRATDTSEDLTSLFQSPSSEHVRDGFRGGSDDDTGVASPPDEPDPDDPATGGLRNA